jgi:hypothetical protein
VDKFQPESTSAIRLTRKPNGRQKSQVTGKAALKTRIGLSCHPARKAMLRKANCTSPNIKVLRYAEAPFLPGVVKPAGAPTNRSHTLLVETSVNAKLIAAPRIAAAGLSRFNYQLPSASFTFDLSWASHLATNGSGKPEGARRLIIRFNGSLLVKR